MRPFRRSMLASLALLAVFFSGADDATGSRKADQEALKGFGELVGDWRGVGQLKRLSNKGAWTEEAGWAWKLSNDSASLVMKVDGGKFVKSAILSPDKAKGTFRLEATLADGSTRSFMGKSAGSEDPLVLLSDGKGDGPRRITLTPRHGTRLIVLYEAKDEAGEFQRLGEVGFTRKGVSFAAGDSYPECIVTGGRGTIEVKYQGKAYKVCCSGCRDLFNENPAAVVAEYEAKKKAGGK